MKTKTVVKTLANLGLISAVRGEFDTDVLPEAILVKNVVDDMVSNVILLRRLLQMDNLRAVLGVNELVSMLEALQKARDIATKEDLAHQLDQYDADTDDSLDSRSTKRLHLKRKRTKSMTKWRTLHKRESVNDMFVHLAKTVLLHFQNDKKLLAQAREKAEPGPDEPTEFVDQLLKFQIHANERIMIPFGEHTERVESLMVSINLKAKHAKQMGKLTSDLEGIQAQRDEKLDKFQAQRNLYEGELEILRNHSQEIIGHHKSQVHAKLKVLAWHSHGRQSKTLDHILELKRELDQCLNEHVQAESDMRKINVKLETEIKDIIDKFDQEMFKKHELIDSISKEYAEETKELNVVLADMEEAEGQQHQLMEENRMEEDTRRLLELMNIRRIIAAKTIQRAWRSRRTRMLMKKKKRKKKSSTRK